MNQVDFKRQDRAVLLRILRNQLFKMVGVVERQLMLVIKGFKSRSMDLVEDVFKLSNKVNGMSLLISDECEYVVGQQLDSRQESRLLIVVVRSIGYLQAVVNQNEKLARMFKDLMTSDFRSHFYRELAFFGEKVYRMLSSVFDALARVDVNQALKLVELDEQINAHFKELDYHVVNQMIAEPTQIRALLYLSHCAKALERIADHAKKISELTIFLDRGETDLNRVDNLSP